jgi:hypothetical protein
MLYRVLHIIQWVQGLHPEITAYVFRVKSTICEICFRTMGSHGSYLCDRQSCTKEGRFQHTFLDVTLPNMAWYWTKRNKIKMSQCSVRRNWMKSVTSLEHFRTKFIRYLAQEAGISKGSSNLSYILQQ